MAGIFQHLPGTSNYSSFLGRDPRDARNLEISSTMEPVESEIKKNSTDRARSGGRRKIRRASERERERERRSAEENILINDLRRPGYIYLFSSDYCLRTCARLHID